MVGNPVRQVIRQVNKIIIVIFDLLMERTVTFDIYSFLFIFLTTKTEIVLEMLT